MEYITFAAFTAERNQGLKHAWCTPVVLQYLWANSALPQKSSTSFLTPPHFLDLWKHWQRILQRNWSPLRPPSDPMQYPHRGRTKAQSCRPPGRRDVMCRNPNTLPPQASVHLGELIPSSSPRGRGCLPTQSPETTFRHHQAHTSGNGPFLPGTAG